MLHLPVYLDNSATTACDPRVVEAMLPFFGTHYGNAASRTHVYGWQAEEAVSLAREQVAALIGATANEITFTSGATESLNLALTGVFYNYQSKGKHLITSTTEHKAVLDTCKFLEKQGAEVTYLEVSAEGRINPEQLKAAIRPDTVLIAIMYANNETGTLQPIHEIGRIAREHQVIFCCDATQAVGKLPVNVDEDCIDLLALSAHKFYGPKGVGALYVRRKNPRVKLQALLHGGGHEKGLRSGTLNVPGIVGLGKAAQLAMAELEQDAIRLAKWRNKLEDELLLLDGVTVNGSREYRLPQVTNLSFAQTESEGLMMNMSQQLAVSSGSACTSAVMEPSYVLKAMGLSDALAYASLRFSLGRFTTEEEINFAIAEITKTVNASRLTWVS